MDDSQFSSQVVISFRFVKTTKQFMRLSHVQEKRRIKFPNTVIGNCIGFLQRDLIPLKSIFVRLLMTRHIMGGDAGLIVILSHVPCPLI